MSSLLLPVKRLLKPKGRARLGGATEAGPAPAWRAGATRANVPYGFNNALATLQSRTAHFHRSAGNQIQVVYWNGYVDTTSNGSTYQELGTGGTLTLTCGYETAGGAITNVTFPGTAASKGLLISNVITVPTFASGDKFYLRPYQSNTSGCLYMPVKADATLGDRLNFGAVDKSQSGTIGSDLAGYAYFPVAILTFNSLRSGFLGGTSRTFGFNDTPDGTTGDIGELARGIGPLAPYCNAGVPGDTLQIAAANYAVRATIANAYYTDTYIEHGVNDNARTLLQKQTDLATIMGQITNRKRLITVSPNTVGAWTAADGSDQTNNRADLAPWNTYLLTKPNGAFACHDVAADHTMAGQPGRWKAPGWTDDGLHGLQAAYLFTQTNGTLTI